MADKREKKIAFVCNYSTLEVRKQICVNPRAFTTKFQERIGALSSASYDFAPWIPEIAKAFEDNDDYQLHVIAMHGRMKKRYINYEKKGVIYHFISAEAPLSVKILHRLYGYLEKTDYSIFKKHISRVIRQINPDVIVICGAENPSYSTVALESFDVPKVVILQTLLNSTKRLQYNFGSPYRLSLEKRIFATVDYYLGYEPEAPKVIKNINGRAQIMMFWMPSIIPPCESDIQKEYDFTFYAGGLAKFKGIEDVIDALALVKSNCDNVSLDVIGSCSDGYKKFLCSKIEALGLTTNIHFTGFFEKQSDVFRQVQKGRCVVVPGITAPLNSTVREAMFLGLPTIVYATSATDSINHDTRCLITAEMENVEDLSKKMLYTLHAPAAEMADLVHNAEVYATNNFTSDAVGEKLKTLIDVIYNNYYKHLAIPIDLQY